MDLNELKNSVSFKYRKNSRGEPFLYAVYRSGDYQQSVIVPMGFEYSKSIDDKLVETMSAIEFNNLDNPPDAQATEIVKQNPRKQPSKTPDDSSAVVAPKTPQQLEKEDEEKVDRIAGI